MSERPRKPRQSSGKNTSKGKDARPTGRSSKKKPSRAKRSSTSEAADRPAKRPATRPFRKKSVSKSTAPAGMPGAIRLNRYLSQAGICSRREADVLIAAGAVSVNGNVVTELGTKVMPGDKVVYGGARLNPETPRYVLLNKPKDFITTTDDPRDRRTVMQLVSKACKERIYPVGRLDRNTTGVLLFTNDGELAKKLTHPSHGAEKMYHVFLDKPMEKGDLKQLVEGIELEDGPASADEASYVGSKRNEVGLRLHVGRNRIVRRMIEHLGYKVVKLDRVVFAGLTKKDLDRGRWRHLTEKEVTLLKRIR